MTTPGQLLRNAREAANLTRPKLAELSGVSASQIVKLERGERTMTVEWAEKFAPHVGGSPRDMMFAAEDAGDDLSKLVSKINTEIKKVYANGGSVALSVSDDNGIPMIVGSVTRTI